MPRLVALISVFGFCISGPCIRAADPWKTSSVLPKSARVRLVDESGRDAGSVFQIKWPAAVEKVDGQWLLVRDAGGYSVPPAAGWVRKIDMLRFIDDGSAVQRTEDPRSYYTERIEGAPGAPDAAEFHWLRGIYYESQIETDVAQIDYEAATHALPGPDSVATLVAADASLRLGRVIAQRQSTDDSIKDDQWKHAFDFAQSQFQSSGFAIPPELYLAWGSAAAGRYKALLRRSRGNDSSKAPAHSDLFDLAQQNFKAANKANPGWPSPFYSLGELYMAKGSAPASVDQAANTKAQQPQDASATATATSDKALVEAVNYFDRAIRLDPRSDQYYCERAKAIFFQAEPPQDIPDASNSLGSNTASAAANSSEPCDAPPKPNNARSGGPSAPGGQTAAKPDLQPSPREKLLRKAADSAYVACSLSYFRNPADLEILAQVIAGVATELRQKDPEAAKAYYDQAADYMGAAVDLTMDVGQKSRLQSFRDSYLKCKKCPQKCNPAPADLGRSVAPLLRSRGPSFGE